MDDFKEKITEKAEDIAGNIKEKADNISQNIRETREDIRERIDQKKPEDLKRFSEILEILKKHNLIREGLSPEKLRSILEDLGPTFIKLGQVMSMRTDFLPAEYCAELEKLRTNVRELTMDEVRQVIETELSGTLEELFDSFDEKPVGSASIAQVHTAVLKDTDKKIVIKVQRPGIREVMTQDISLMRKAVKMLKIIPVDESIDIADVVEEMWTISQEELDFMVEARHINEFYENCRETDGVTCPAVENSLTNSKILVMEYIDGYSIGNTEQLDTDGIDRTELGSRLAESFMKQVLDDGFFHADPHPGNIRIRNGEIVWIDMGMMGRITPKDRKLFKKAVKAVVRNDIDDIISAVMSIGVCKEPVNYNMMYEDVDNMLRKYSMMDLGEVDLSVFLDEMITLMKKHKIAVPKGMAMLARSILTIEGVLSESCPGVNAVDIARRKITAETISDFDIKKEIKDTVSTMFSSGVKSIELPGNLNDLLKATLKGHTKINLDLTGSEMIMKKLSQMVNRLVMGLVIASLIIGSSTLCTSEGTPRIFGISLGFFGYVAVAVIGIWILITSNRE